MYKGITVGAITTIGNKHVNRGTPCEDASYAVTKNGVSVVCIADGAGGKQYTDWIAYSIFVSLLFIEHLASIYKGECKSKGSTAVVATDRQIFTVAANNGADDVKAKSPTVPILGAALVQFMESLKKKRQLFRRNGFSLVGHGHINLVAGRMDGKLQQTFYRAEFYGIVHQVVDNLGDIFLGGIGKHGQVRHIHLDV